MTTLSQSKKIALAAVAIFIVSFTMLLVFLGEANDTSHNGSASVMGSHAESPMDTAHGEEEGIIGPGYLEFIKGDEAAVFVTNPEGVLIHVSKGFCTLVDTKCSSFDGNSIFDYINSKDVSDLAGTHGKIVHDGHSIDGLGPYRMLKGAKEIMLLFDAEPLIGKDEKVENIIFRVKDITEKVEELNTTTKNNSEEEVDNLESPEIKENENWIQHLYPKVDELKSDDSDKLIVTK